MRPGTLAVIECGAGTASPSVRHLCEQVAADKGRLLRLNSREPEVPEGALGLPLRALEALRGIEEELRKG